MLKTDNSLNKILSIRINTDGFYFSTHSYSVRKEFLSHNHLGQLKSELENFLHQQSDFDSLCVLFETPKFSLFPTEYDSAENDFGKLFSLSANEKLLQTSSLDLKMKTLYAVDAEMWNYFQSQFKNVQFSHTLSFLLGHLRGQESMRRLYLDIYSDKLYAVVAEGKRLILANSFPFDSDEMFVYQVANLFVQFGLNQQETEVLAADFDLSGKKRKLLQKYVKKVVVI